MLCKSDKPSIIIIIIRGLCLLPLDLWCLGHDACIGNHLVLNPNPDPKP